MLQQSQILAKPEFVYSLEPFLVGDRSVNEEKIINYLVSGVSCFCVGVVIFGTLHAVEALTEVVVIVWGVGV